MHFVVIAKSPAVVARVVGHVNDLDFGVAIDGQPEFRLVQQGKSRHRLFTIGTVSLNRNHGTSRAEYHSLNMLLHFDDRQSPERFRFVPLRSGQIEGRELHRFPARDNALPAVFLGRRQSTYGNRVSKS
jgi:hypothetical protein